MVNVSKEKFPEDKQRDAINYAKEGYAGYLTRTWTGEAWTYFQSIRQWASVSELHRQQCEYISTLFKTLRDDDAVAKRQLWREINKLRVSRTKSLSAKHKEIFIKAIDATESDPEGAFLIARKLTVAHVRRNPKVEAVPGAEYYPFFVGTIKQKYLAEDYKGDDHIWWATYDISERSWIKTTGIEIIPWEPIKPREEEKPVPPEPKPEEKEEIPRPPAPEEEEKPRPPIEEAPLPPPAPLEEVEMEPPPLMPPPLEEFEQQKKTSWAKFGNLFRRKGEVEELLEQVNLDEPVEEIGIMDHVRK